MQETTTITWKNEYKIGDNNIDKEHEEFFRIAEKTKNIQNIENDKDKRSELSKIIMEIYQYINFHFTNEEKHMQKINYPLFQEHKKLHHQMKDQINFINFSLKTISIEQAQIKLFDFVQKIFVAHIINEDKKIVNFSKS